eukprot:scaffold608_cov248-Pinguiococcus_pyrenoidosus.AAC.8
MVGGPDAVSDAEQDTAERVGAEVERRGGWPHAAAHLRESGSVPEDEAGVEFLYEDEVLRPKAVEEATPEAAPVTRSGRRKSSSKLEEARAKALRYCRAVRRLHLVPFLSPDVVWFFETCREQNERKTERIRVLRNKKSPQTSA